MKITSIPGVVREGTRERAPESGSVCVSVSQKDDFCYDSLPTENTYAKAQVDMTLFLTDTSRDIDCLHTFPLSKKLFFLKYNTTLLSSGTRSSADADNGLDAFSSQSRSINMVPFSVHCDFSLSM